MRTTLNLVLALALGAVLGATAHAQATPPAPPPPPPAPQQKEGIPELIRKLGDASFENREAAQRELERIGRPALKALDEAAKSQDPEVATRASEAIARIRGGRGEPNQPQVEDPAGEPEERRRPPGFGDLPKDFPQGMPDTDELMREMERQLGDQMPEELKPLLRMFRRFGQDEQGQPGQEEQPGAPRVRVFRWPNDTEQRTEMTLDGALGWELGLAPAVVRAQLGIEGNEGVVVTQLEGNSAAAKAGVKQHDVIVGLDGRSVRSTRDLQNLSRQGGTLTLYRRAKIETVVVPAPTPSPPAPPAPPAKPGEQRSF